MQELTKENFDAAIKKCQETDCYKVLVVTEYLGDQLFIQENWLDPAKIEFNKSRNGINMYFPNGSWLRGISLSSNARGRRADLILCEPWMLIDEDIRDVLQAVERNYTEFKIGYVDNPKLLEE